MTASEVIEQIKTLPANEQAEVAKYLRTLPDPVGDEVSPEMKKMAEETFDQYDGLFKKLEEGTVNEGIRTAKAEYLRHCMKTVGIINEKGEYEVIPTKQCEEGDTVWVMEDNGTFTKTKIY